MRVAREITAFILVPIALAVIVVLPPWAYLAAVWLLCALAAWELLDLLRLRHPVAVGATLGVLNSGASKPPSGAAKDGTSSAGTAGAASASATVISSKNHSSGVSSDRSADTEGTAAIPPGPASASAGSSINQTSSGTLGAAPAAAVDTSPLVCRTGPLN